jgi:hypothetical protein
MDDFEEERSISRVKYEDSSINGFGSQIAFESLVNSHSVNIGVIYKPNSLIAEQFCIIQRV